MDLTGLRKIVYLISKYVMNFAYLNILWILFTLAGFVLLGFFPATAAMFAVTRKMMIDGESVPIFRTFIDTFKTKFLKVNILGLVVVAVGYILYLDFTVFLDQEAFVYKIHRIGLVFIIFVYISFCMFFFPVFTHYKLRTFQYFKRTLFIVFLVPLSTLGMFLATIGHFLILLKIPGFILFFSGSVLSYAWMWIAHKSFIYIEEKKAKDNSS